MGKEDGKVGKALKATNMKEIIYKIKNMDLEYLHGQVEIYTKENIKKMKEMVMEK